MLHASFPRSVALTQLRFTLLAVTSSQRDLHPQVCAHAGRTREKGLAFTAKPLIRLVGRTRFELVTNGLKVRKQWIS